MLYRHRKVILLFIILIGFALRFYSAIAKPINEDEWNDLKIARMISFDSKNLNLPVIDERSDSNCPMPFYYVVKSGLHVFGDFLLGARLPFIILGTITILLVYFFVKSVLGVGVALFSSFLLSISQLAISITRFADLNVIVMLISIVSLFLFYKSLINKNKYFLLLNGLLIGIGFWFRESICLLIPIYIVFLLSCREYRVWLKNRYVWTSFATAFFLMLPRICLILSPGVSRIEYIYKTVHTGISMNPLALYLGELILLIIKPFPEFFNRVAGTVNSEYMFVNFTLGVLIFAAVVTSLRSKKPIIRLLSVFFLSEFVLFSFIRSGDPNWGIWNFESFYYGLMGFIPAVILVANMLINFINRNRFSGILISGFLVIFMLIRAWGCATFPLNYFFPAKDFCIEELLNRKGGCFRNNNDIPVDTAKDVFEKIYRVTNDKPVYKRKAAFNLSEILIREGRHRESRRYLYYILSQDSEDRDALRLLGGQ